MKSEEKREKRKMEKKIKRRDRKRERERERERERVIRRKRGITLEGSRPNKAINNNTKCIKACNPASYTVRLCSYIHYRNETHENRLVVSIENVDLPVNGDEFTE